MAWAKEEARLETQKYKGEQRTKAVQITFHSDRTLAYDQQVFYRGGYLFLQSIYRRTKLTDKLHEACGFRTDYEFITKSQMKTIQKKSKGK